MCAEKSTPIVDSMLPAVVLAGGYSRRMKGVEKIFTRLNGEPLLHHVIRRIRPQVSDIVISSNGRPENFDRWEVPVVSDAGGSDKGPLAGILAGMNWAKARNSNASHIISVPADTPFLPQDFVMRLIATANETCADIVVARSAGQAHFVAALWSLKLDDSLFTFLTKGSIPRVEQFIGYHKNSVANFSASDVDPFFNVNTPEDLKAAENFLHYDG